MKHQWFLFIIILSFLIVKSTYSNELKELNNEINKSDKNSILNTLALNSSKSIFLQFSFINGGYSKIVDRNIANLTLKKNYHEWNVKSNLSYGVGFEIGYMLEKNIGISMGVGFSQYETTYSLSSENITPPIQLLDSLGMNVFADPNKYSVSNINYYKILDIPHYDSIVTFKTINIPVLFNYCFNLSEKLLMNLRTGLEVGIIRQPEYSVKGNLNYYALIDSIELLYGTPQDDEISYIIVYPEDDFNDIFGLFRREVEEKNQQLRNISSFTLNYIINAGLEIPLSESISLNLSAVTKFGITDISKNKNDYTDIFGQTETDISRISNHIFKHKAVKTFMYLFDLGFKFKF